MQFDKHPPTLSPSQALIDLISPQTETDLLLKMQFPRFLNAGLHATSADLPPPFLTAELHQCASVDPRLVRPAATQRTESSMWRMDSD